MTSNKNQSTSSPMFSISKACLELSKSIKNFRFTGRPPPTTTPTTASSEVRDNNADAAMATGSSSQPTASGGPFNTKASHSGLAETLTTPPTSLSSDVSLETSSPITVCGTGEVTTSGATAADVGNSVTNAISRVLRSATNKVRSFPSSSYSSSSSPPSPTHQQQTKAAATANGNGHSPAHAQSLPVVYSTSSPSSLPSAVGAQMTSSFGPTSGGSSVVAFRRDPTLPDIWTDEQFLLRFFRYFTAFELCVLAQVNIPKMKYIK